MKGMRLGLAMLGASIATSASIPNARFPLPPDTEAIAPAIVTLKRQVSPVASGSRRRAESPGKATIRRAALFDFVYTAEVTIGAQTFDLTVDTGSADTWVVQSGFNCQDPYGRELRQSACGFAKTFNGSFSQGMSKDLVLAQQYASGETVIGPLGHEKVAVGGLTIEKQQLALVSIARDWAPQHNGHGLLGLAGPDLTFAYQGQVSGGAFSINETRGRFSYDPLVTTMFKKGNVTPIFSLALDRAPGSNTGVLAFGGVANVSIQSGGFAKSAMVDWHLNETLVIKDFYMIAPGAVKVGSTKDSATSLPTKFTTAVDSGSTVSFFPPDVVNALLSAFRRGTVASDDSGMYYVLCTATAPAFGLQIGDRTFWFDTKDLILPFLRTGDYCLLGIQAAEEPYVLGQNFLANVLAVFDVGARELRFAERVPY